MMNLSTFDGGKGGTGAAASLRASNPGFKGKIGRGTLTPKGKKSPGRPGKGGGKKTAKKKAKKK